MAKPNWEEIRTRVKKRKNLGTKSLRIAKQYYKTATSIVNDERIYISTNIGDIASILSYSSFGKTTKIVSLKVDMGI